MAAATNNTIIAYKNPADGFINALTKQGELVTTYGYDPRTSAVHEECNSSFDTDGIMVPVEEFQTRVASFCPFRGITVPDNLAKALEQQVKSKTLFPEFPDLATLVKANYVDPGSFVWIVIGEQVYSGVILEDGAILDRRGQKTSDPSIFMTNQYEYAGATPPVPMLDGWALISSESMEGNVLGYARFLYAASQGQKETLDEDEEDVVDFCADRIWCSFEHGWANPPLITDEPLAYDRKAFSRKLCRSCRV